MSNGPSYQVMASITAAIADFPRVRAYLAEKVAVAEAALRAFEREHIS
jgi:hypothetical protein